MDEALFRLIGDTLAALAAGLSLVDPSREMPDGFACATQLLEDEAAGTPPLVESAVAAICHVIAAEGTSAAAEPVLAALSGVVRRFASRADVLAEAFEPESSDPLSIAKSVTLAVLTPAIRDGAWPADADARLAAGILEALLLSIFEQSDRLDALRRSLTREPAALEAVEQAAAAQRVASDEAEGRLPAPLRAEADVGPAKPAEGETPPSSALPRAPLVTPADIELARASGLTAEAISMLRRQFDDAPEPASELRVASCARAVVDLADRLQENGLEANQSDQSDQFRSFVVAALKAGRFEEADQILSGAEGRHLRAAQQDLHRVGVHMGRAAEMRLARAELAGALGSYRRAARHMVSALRCVPAGERTVRWQFMMRQGAFLRAGARRGDRPALLREAAMAYEAAAREAGATDNQFARSSALVEWAGAVLELVRDGGDRQLASAAADAVGEALPHIVTGTAEGLWGQAQLNLGHAILLSATSAPEVAQLQSASEAFAAAVLALGPDRRPDAWIEAQGWYGFALARLAAATGEHAYADRAVQYLEEAIASPDRRAFFATSMAELGVALGETARDVGRRRGDLRLLLVAANGYAMAIAAIREAGQSTDLSHHEEQHAACLAAIGEATGDVQTLTAAAECLGRAIADAEQNGDLMRSGLLRGELERLRSVTVELAGNPGRSSDVEAV